MVPRAFLKRYTPACVGNCATFSVSSIFPSVRCRDYNESGAGRAQPGNIYNNRVNHRESAMRTKTASVLLLLMTWMATATALVAAQGAPPPPITAEEPSFDPLRANKDIEVGTFYLKKGNYDAAIDRFEEAARLQPGLAAPYLKLGETYEKKKDLPSAVTAYRKYL